MARKKHNALTIDLLAFTLVAGIFAACKDHQTSNPLSTSLHLGESQARAQAITADWPTTPCPQVGGQVSPDWGSGMCTGNWQVTIPLPSIGLSLIYNSADFKFNSGFGYGFRLSAERCIEDRDHDGDPSTPDMKVLVLGDGTQIPLDTKNQLGAPYTDGYHAIDPRMIKHKVDFASGNETILGGTVAHYSPVAGTTRRCVDKITTRNGEEVIFDRDPSTGRINYIYYPNSRTVRIVYTGGTPAKVDIQDFTGGHYILDVDADKQPTTDTFGTTYDPLGRLAKVTYPVNDGTIQTSSNGAWTINYAGGYPAIGLVTSASGETETIEYFDNRRGVVRRVTDNLGRITKFKYESNIEQCASGPTNIRRVSVGDDFKLFTEAFIVDDSTKKPYLTETFSNKVRTSFTLDDKHRLSKITSHLGGTSEFTYRGDTYLLFETVDSSGGGPVSSAFYSYIDNSDDFSLPAVERQCGATASCSGGSGGYVESVYSWAGSPAYVDQPSSVTMNTNTGGSVGSQTTNYDLDASGNILKVTGPGSIVTFEATYSGAVPHLPSSTTNQYGLTTQFAWGSNQSYVDITDPFGRVSRMKFDVAGRVSAAIMPNYLARDASNQRLPECSLADGTNCLATAYHYDAMGQRRGLAGGSGVPSARTTAKNGVIISEGVDWSTYGNGAPNTITEKTNTTTPSGGSGITVIETKVMMGALAKGRLASTTLSSSYLTSSLILQQSPDQFSSIAASVVPPVN